MKFQINPTPQIVLALVVAVLTLAAKGSVALPLGVPPVVGEYVTSWSNFLLQLYAVVAPILLGFSSSMPGPLAPKDPPGVVIAQAKADAADAAADAKASEK